ncbi:MAG: YcaO-like family protein [Acidobacteria bacterium]|nr:YcaO-like family protein [Acidobacteriota bacterium]MBW4046041.1 YcaO-like family protein [Acidobacteriota bacterium]
MTAYAADRLLCDTANGLAMEVREEPADDWPLALSRHAYCAQVPSSAGSVEGFGVGRTPDEARCRAIMEGAERFSQFCTAPSQLQVATGASLGDEKISPHAMGLYADAQYAKPGFPFSPYAEDHALEWIAVEDLCNRQRSYVPVEFVYPRIPLQRKKLVAETSSGTAAHTSLAAAQLAAICELVERDSILLFWHRRPGTGVLQVDAELSPDAAGDLDAMRRMGFVIVVCRLDYDLAIPCVLSFALKGNRVAYGAGCHPSLKLALEHSARELGNLLRWQISFPAPRPWMTLQRVTDPADHHALYDDGPFHSLIRDTLEDAVRARPSRSHDSDNKAMEKMAASDALQEVSARLCARGLRIYTCDLTPPSMQACGVSVVRALAPGLIPMYFGYDRLRLGCRRLWMREAPGRLCNLLPHFMS